ASKARRALRHLLGEDSPEKRALQEWVDQFLESNDTRYGSHLYSERKGGATALPAVPPIYAQDGGEVDGRLILRDNFDALFEKFPEVLIFGEDTGAIGDVNQGLEGMQKKYGELRVAD